MVIQMMVILIVYIQFLYSEMSAKLHYKLLAKIKTPSAREKNWLSERNLSTLVHCVYFIQMKNILEWKLWFFQWCNIDK